MSKIDPKCEHTRIRLIAAAVGHQQCTKTAANVIPLPGTKRFITIGTPAEVIALLRREVPDRGPIIGEGDGAALAEALGDWMTQSVLHPETNLPEDVAALFGACGFEIRSTDPAEKHPFAIAGSLDAAGLRVETVLTELAPDTSAANVDMLGQPDPFGVPEQKALWFERLSRARAMQQPLPVPSGAVVVWRTDLVSAVAELLQLRAYREHHQAKLAQQDQDKEGAAS